MGPLSFVLAFAGFALGVLYRMEYAILSGVVGFLFGMVIDLKIKLDSVEKKLSGIIKEAAEAKDSILKDKSYIMDNIPAASSEEEPEEKPDEESYEKSVESFESIEPEPVKVSKTPPPLPPEYTAEPELKMSDSKESEIFDNKYLSYVKDFVLKGNIVARVGFIVLFFGVGFLLKYATEMGYFPLEARYIAAGAGAVILLLTGWKLREKHRTYGLILQGGAIGLLYIIVFAAAKLSFLIPLSMAFAVMVLLAVLSGILSVLQDARSTAWYGACGGFLAPVLTSTGSGNHIALFSFYAILNSGILLIAFKKSWRELNLLSFFFTFGIGTFWGVRSYNPELLISSELFLILFFLFFFVISILFAYKQPPKLKGYVDGTLVFGLPTIAFSIQTYLMRDIEYGLSISSLILGFFYIVTAKILWNRKIEGMRTLTEAFLSMGVVFLTLAIPLAFDGNWTSAAWGLEGAALIFVGIRQKRILARAGGLLLQAGAGYFYIDEFVKVPDFIYGTLTPVFNEIYLGAFLIAVSGFISGYFMWKGKEVLKEYEKNISTALFFWGLLWWTASGLFEIRFNVDFRWLSNSFLVFLFSTLLVSNRASKVLKWEVPSLTDFTALPLLALYFLTISIRLKLSHPLENLGFLALPFAFAVYYYILFTRDNKSPEKFKACHPAGFYFVVLTLTWELYYIAKTLMESHPAWYIPLIGLIPAFSSILLTLYGSKIVWPVRKNEELYFKWAAPFPLLFSVLYCIFAFSIEANPYPLPYITFVNPVELSQFAVILLSFIFVFKYEKKAYGLPEFLSFKIIKIALGFVLFFTFNSVIARSVHFYAFVPFSFESLMSSMVYHASLSIFWTVLALILTFTATKKEMRELWIIGTSLLVLVVLKLFIVDFATSQTGTKIVSGIAVGVIMLVIGFFAPVPPKKKEDNNV